MMNPSLRTSSASSDDTRASIAANLANKLSMSTDSTGSTDHSAPPATWLPHPAPQMVDPRYPVTVEPRLEPVGSGDNTGHVVGDHHLEHAIEERPRLLEPGDHRLGRLREAQPHETVTRVAGGEDQRLTHPTPAADRAEDQAHPAEIDLQLHPRLAIGHPNRRPPSRASHAQHFKRVAVQDPLRHGHPPPGKQLARLDHRQALIDQPRLQVAMVGDQYLPRLTSAPRPMWPDLLADLRHHCVAQLPVAA